VEAARFAKLFVASVRRIGAVRVPRSSMPEAVMGWLWVRPAVVRLRLLDAETFAPAVDKAEGTAVLTEPRARTPAFLKPKAWPEVAIARVPMLFELGKLKAVVAAPDRTWREEAERVPAPEFWVTPPVVVTSVIVAPGAEMPAAAAKLMPVASRVTSFEAEPVEMVPLTARAPLVVSANQAAVALLVVNPAAPIAVIVFAFERLTVLPVDPARVAALIVFPGAWVTAPMTSAGPVPISRVALAAVIVPRITVVADWMVTVAPVVVRVAAERSTEAAADDLPVIVIVPAPALTVPAVLAIPFAVSETLLAPEVEIFPLMVKVPALLVIETALPIVPAVIGPVTVRPPPVAVVRARAAPLFTAPKVEMEFEELLRVMAPVEVRTRVEAEIAWLWVRAPLEIVSVFAPIDTPLVVFTVAMERAAASV